MATKINAGSAVLALTALCLALLPAQAAADTGCDHFASPTGSDGNPGTQGSPVRSIARLIEITGAGEEGCLPAGSKFVEPLGSFIVDEAGGAPGNPARIRTADPQGDPAIVEGAMWLKGPVHDLTFERIRFTGSPGNNDKGTMLVVDGDRITFRYTEMTWRRGICLNAGHRDGYALGDPPGTVAAEGLVVEHSRIHDCGNDPEIIASLRAAGQSGVHGLYLVYAPNARIRDNYIYDNVDRGIQFWPDVDGAIVEHNVFDGNGSNINVGSEAAYGHFSEDNLFKDNIVSNAILRSVYDSPWGPGDTESIHGNFPDDGNTRGNEFVGNCVYQAVSAEAYGGFGYTQTGDVFADPMYTDRADNDFSLKEGSPCAGKGPRSESGREEPPQEEEREPPEVEEPPRKEQPRKEEPPPPPLGAGIAVAGRVVQIRGNVALLRLSCLGLLPCAGRAEIFAGVPPEQGQGSNRVLPRSRRLTIAKSRFSLAPGERATIPATLARGGRRLLRQAVRGDLTATVTGSGIKSRTVQLRGFRGATPTGGAGRPQRQ